MSWDVMVFDSSAAQVAPQELLNQWKRGWRTPPLGIWSDVRRKITQSLPEFEWPSPQRIGPAFYQANDLWLEIHEPDDEPVFHFKIAVRTGGGGDPIPILVTLAKANGWALIDMSTGEWIDLEQPNCAGWKGFKRFCSGPDQ